MKKIIMCMGLMSILMLSSCGKKEEKTTDTIETNTVTNTVETDTVVKEVPVEENGTSVKVSNEGINVDSKDVKVEVK